MNKLYSETKHITPQIAKDLLGSNYKNNRKLRKYHVNYLASEMLKGRFSPTSIIAVAKLGDGISIINGQHTLEAIVKSGCEQTLTMQYHIVENEEEIKQLYTRYDVGKKRTFTDMSSGYGLPAQLGMRTKEIQQVYAAVKFINAEFLRHSSNVHKLSPEDYIELVIQWHEYYKTYKQATSPIDTKMRSRLDSSPTLSVALVTMKYQPDKAIEFWEQVAKDDGLRRGDTRKTYNKYLVGTVVKGSRSSNESAQRTPNLISRVAAKCWNYWMDGKTLKVIKESIMNENAPIVIAGTPYTKIK